jgi:hypothetical protein
MKRMRLLLGVMLTLSVGTISSFAHGCGFGIGFGISCLGIGIGFGTGWHCPSYGCYYGYGYPACGYSGYAYTYAPPAYAYSPPASYTAPEVAAAPAAPVAPIDPPTPAWVPQTAGAGHWVPEPQPYCHTPTAPAKQADAAIAGQTVITIQSPGGVRVYVADR